MKTKICTHCKKEKPLDQFNKGNDKDGLGFGCVECGKKYYQKNRQRIITYTKNYIKKHKNKVIMYMNKYGHTIRGIYASTKSKAKKRHIIFTLNKEEFINWFNKQEKVCVYCERTEKEAIKDKNRHCNRLTIDRKDNQKGYSSNNIVLCCHRCNTIKSNEFSYEQMLRVGEIIKKKI